MDTPATDFRADFPSTSWSLIRRCADPGDSGYRERMERLCGDYWKPVYAYVRRAWRLKPDDARDLTQDFFLTLLEKDLVGRFRNECGRFRTFLLAALKNFLVDADRHRKAVKRGSGRAPVSIGDDEEREFPVADSDALTPEQAFDRQWAAEILARAYRELERSLKASDREVYFRVFEAIELDQNDGGEIPYSGVAARLGVDAHDVRNYLHRARQELRSILLKMVSDSVSSAEDLQGEVRDLFG